MKNMTKKQRRRRRKKRNFRVIGQQVKKMTKKQRHRLRKKRNFGVIGKQMKKMTKKQRRRRRKKRHRINKKRRHKRSRKRNARRRRRKREKRLGVQRLNRFYRYDYTYSDYLSWLSFMEHEQRPHSDSPGIESGPADPDSNYYYRMPTSLSSDMCTRFQTMDNVMNFARKRYSMPDYINQYSCYWRCKIYHECGRYPNGNEAYWEGYCTPMDQNPFQYAVICNDCPLPEPMPYFQEPRDGAPGAPVSFVSFV